MEAVETGVEEVGLDTGPLSPSGDSEIDGLQDGKKWLVVCNTDIAS